MAAELRVFNTEKEVGTSRVYLIALTYPLAKFRQVLLMGESPKTSGRKLARIDAFALKVLENFYKCLTSFTDR